MCASSSARMASGIVGRAGGAAVGGGAVAGATDGGGDPQAESAKTAVGARTRARSNVFGERCITASCRPVPRPPCTLLTWTSIDSRQCLRVHPPHGARRPPQQPAKYAVHVALIVEPGDRRDAAQRLAGVIHRGEGAPYAVQL